MRVSIITPTYNRSKLLSETIDSILNQNYPDLEYIVIDDGSIDDTQNLLSKNSERIKTHRLRSMGETASVIKGFSMVTGEIVCVVSSDDPLLPGSIQQVVERFKKFPEAVAVYPNWYEIGPNSEQLREVYLPDYNINNMIKTYSWGLGPGTFFRRSVIDQVGGRDPERVYCGDMEFWAKVAIIGKLVHIPAMLATHRKHSDSASVNQLGKMFAAEWVDTWKSILNLPNLPLKLKKRKFWTLAIVHLIAARSYCGKDYIFSILLIIHSIPYALLGSISITKQWFYRFLTK